MKLYLIRHGQSTANAERRIHNFKDPLSEKGIEQAKAVGKYLEGIRFDKVYSSDMDRALMTAQYAMPGVTPVSDPLLREINVGELVGKTPEECIDKYGMSFRRDRLIRDYTGYGGENEQMLMARVRVFLAKAEECGLETVAAFTHGGFINATLEALFGVNVVTSQMMICENAMIAIFEFSDRCWRLHSWNINNANG